MSRVSAKGYFDEADTEEARYKAESYAKAGEVVDPLPEDAPQFVKGYHVYYKTPRGYHARSVNSNAGWTLSSMIAMFYIPMLTYVEEIRTPVLIVHGEKAHSRYMGEDTFKRLKVGR